MMEPILYSFRRCPYAMRARMALILSSTRCELREVLLKNKPDEMLRISAKGTVPILHLPDKVIDESLDIIAWAMEINSKKVHPCSEAEQIQSNYLIQLFDSKFKHHLDRYKYSSRFGADNEEHQHECKLLLEKLEESIDPNPWIFGEVISLLDISILPFIRQCKIANPAWFLSQDFKKIIHLLEQFEISELFELTMQKFETWSPNSKDKLIFP